jgi:archaellum component FlaC
MDRERTDEAMEDFGRQIGELREEMRDGFKGLRSEIKDVRSEIKDVRSEIKDVRSEIKDVRSEIKDVRSEMDRRFDTVHASINTLWAATVGGFVAIFVAMVGGLVALLPHL